MILIAGITAMKDTVSPLLGQAPEPELVDEIEKIVRANADRLLAAGKKGTVKPLDPSEVIKPAAAAEAPAAPAAKTTGSEVDLDIMVDE